MSSTKNPWMRGIVKAVPSGDSLVIMAIAPKDSVPPEKTITLSSVIAPRLARRDGLDEPFAWESREFLRKLCIGKEVIFKTEYTVPSIGREFGSVFQNNKNVASLVVAAGWGKVKEPVTKKGEQKTNNVEASPILAELQRLEKQAELQGLGRWNTALGASEASIRKLPPSAIGDSTTFNFEEFAERNKGKPIEAIVEHVRDGSTIRAYLLPEFQFVQVLLPGVQAPSMGKRPTEPNEEASIKPGGSVTSAQRFTASTPSSVEHVPQPFAKEAKHFTETCVLHREVRIVVEGYDKNSLIGSLYYPDGESAKDLALQLVENGLASYVEWSAKNIDDEARKRLKSAELEAKTSRIRKWTNYLPHKSSSTAIHNQKFTGKVVEVVSGDCIIVADDSIPFGSPLAERRVNLSSIRCPKPPRRDSRMDPLGSAPNKDGKPQPSVNTSNKEVETDSQAKTKKEKDERDRKIKEEKDGFYAREAKEFLRSRLIGRQVNVLMEYSRKITNSSEGDGAAHAAGPKDKDSKDRDMNFGSVFFESPVKVGGAETPVPPGNSQGSNVAELLVARGLTEVVRHRDFEERSNYYDALVSAESRAKATKRGRHSNKDPAPVHINDLTTELGKKKAKDHLQPFLRERKIHAVVEYVFSGHRFKLLVPSQTCSIFFSLSGVRCPGRDEPYSKEAIAFMRRKIMQKDVEIDVETVDRNGTFLGSLWESNTNVSVALVEAGLAKLQSSFGYDNLKDGHLLMQAEQSAKSKKLKIWENFVEGEVASNGSSSADRKHQKKEMKVTVTEVMGGGLFYVQSIEDETVAPIQKQLASLTIQEAPLIGAFNPQKGEIVLAQFSADNSWNRAMIVNGPQVKAETKNDKGKIVTENRLQVTSASDKYEVFYIDYGNQETVSYSQIRPLDNSVSSDPGLAQLCKLAYIKVPSLEQDYGEEAAYFMSDLTLNGSKEFKAVIEEKDTSAAKVKGQGTGPIHAITLIDTSSDTSVNADMLLYGLAKMEKKRGWKPRDVKAAMEELEKHQTEAKTKRRGIWEYGDVQSDDEDNGPPVRKAAGKR